MKQHINKEFWDEYSKLYNSFTPKIQKKLLKDISSLAIGKTLDYGCGVGKLLPYLIENKNVKNIYLLDSSKVMLKYAKQKIPKKYPKIEIVKESQFEKESLDSLIFVNSLYANSNPIKIIQENSKKLKKNGKLIIADMRRKSNFNKLSNLIKEEFQNNSELNKYLTMNEKLMKNLVPRSYELEEISYILELMNFKIKKTSQKYFKGSCYLIEAIKN